VKAFAAITSLIDVMLVLLIILMVVTPIAQGRWGRAHGDHVRP
jgi:biopolymer transport protein ExbD